jgi:glutamine synthetase type III
MANFDRRQRGRFSSRRNGRRQNGSSRPSQVIKLNDNGSFNQRIKFNGNASKLFEKYNKLASEALSSGDKVMAEYYFQHADHFARLIPDISQTQILKENQPINDVDISEGENQSTETLDNSGDSEIAAKTVDN